MTDTNVNEIIKDCQSKIAQSFFDAIKNDNSFLIKSYNGATEKNFQQRCKLTYNNFKITVVYDTKAAILTITSKPEAIEKLKSVFNNCLQNSETLNTAKPPTQSQKPSEQAPEKSMRAAPLNFTGQAIMPVVTVPKASAKPAQAPQSNSIVPALSSVILSQSPKHSPRSAKRGEAEVNAMHTPALRHVNRISTQNESLQNTKPTVSVSKKLSETHVKSQPKKSSAVPQQKTENTGQNNDSPEYKDGVSIKNYDLKRFEGALKLIKAVNGFTVECDKAAAANAADDVRTYTIIDKQKQKAYIRFLPLKKLVILQGKPTNLSKELLKIIDKDTPYKAAVSTYIKQSGEEESAGQIEKKLKKLIPDGFEFLSLQSKKDLTFALIDIHSEETKLSDYSNLLVSPYRALERMIYDLQTAQGIEVKMIGQAYEKTNSGAYTLKSGYRKKIPGVIYNEVMCSLYTEYFEKRNFYLHSDNSINWEPRIISEKQEAKKIFDNLLTIINYNCQKLKEINFRIV